MEYRTQKKLADWLVEECELRDWAWTEACRRAGVASNTLSELVNGTRIGMSRIVRLARAFEVEPNFLLELAGMLPWQSSASDESGPLAPTLRYKADQIMTMWRAIYAVDAASAERLAAMAVLQSEMLAAALKIDLSSMPEEEVHNENAHSTTVS